MTLKSPKRTRDLKLYKGELSGIENNCMHQCPRLSVGLVRIEQDPGLWFLLLRGGYSNEFKCHCACVCVCHCTCMCYCALSFVRDIAEDNHINFKLNNKEMCLVSECR